MTVDRYLAAQPEAVRAVLERVRAIVKKALPRATEGIGYRILEYRVDDRMVLYVAGFAKHVAIYPATARVVAELRDAIAGRLHGKGTIRFAIDAPIPARVVTRIAKVRAAEAKDAAGAKRAKTTR